MKWRRWLILLVLLATAPSAILWLRAARHQPRITREAYKQIQLGMSLAEVEAILGGPPGDYSSRKWSGEGAIHELWLGFMPCSPDNLSKDWFDEDFDIRVFFSDEGLAIDKCCALAGVCKETLRGRLYRKLRRAGILPAFRL
jgi:hypothetical protein